MFYPVAAVEWAMKLQEVICRALAGRLTWLQAADILGMHVVELAAGTVVTAPPNRIQLLPT